MRIEWLNNFVPQRSIQVLHKQQIIQWPRQDKCIVIKFPACNETVKYGARKGVRNVPCQGILAPIRQIPN